jgi:hypothetical protein
MNTDRHRPEEFAEAIGFMPSVKFASLKKLHYNHAGSCISVKKMAAKDHTALSGIGSILRAVFHHEEHEGHEEKPCNRIFQNFVLFVVKIGFRLATLGSSVSICGSIACMTMSRRL